MSQRYYNRAQRERELRRKQFYQRMKEGKIKYSAGGDEATGVSYFLMRRLAPFAAVNYLLFGLSIIFFAAFNISSIQSEIKIYPVEKKLVPFEVSRGNAIYAFEVRQEFSAYAAPVYSELEIEILDKDYDHIYSVYKDLWQERHPNEEGGTSVYSDKKVEFKVILPEAGKYYFRPISYNDNQGKISISVKKQLGGTYLFSYLLLITGILSVILILGTPKWGGPARMMTALKEIADLEYNIAFIWFARLCIIIFLTIFVLSVMKFGYAAGGDETVLPSALYRTKGVFYLG